MTLGPQGGRWSRLESRIPPDLIWVGVAALMWLTSLWTPAIALSAPVRISGTGVLLAAGIVLIVAGRVALARARTTWRPSSPEDTTHLVTVGVYRSTRNPIYLGMLLILLAWAMWLANPVALALCAVFVAYVDRFQIRPEERALSQILGQDYAEYTARVRRWI
jgi:protein-S-isoprenylcysteine O-methyltransferase Ste14